MLEDWTRLRGDLLGEAAASGSSGGLVLELDHGVAGIVGRDERRLGEGQRRLLLLLDLLLLDPLKKPEIVLW